ncbi:MAG: histidine--tRNA ligase [Marinilabiliaceae bacterium]|jgi:histidyl-tRNA synthetase|nr:histidine--tRNA ligase [Marinilabiliaceae bacterium]
MASGTAIPKGTRDFGPFEMVRRNYIFDSIKRVFKKYGYLPLETPAMENLSSLLGKYGEEGDRLLFRILNSGDYLKKTKRNELADIGSLELSNLICEKGLKYDLTVPFARFVVQHLNEITFPFKRFQIQPVWRADRPQKGRYREFYQCDVDVIGSNSLYNEYELILIIDEVFSELGINNTIKLNNRKILLGIAELIGEKDRLTDITVAIDKIEKIGIDRVNEELEQKGIPQQAIKRLQPVLFLEGGNRQKLNKLKEILKDSETGLAGLDEMLSLLDYLDRNKLKSEIEIDLTLARGLNYYTGAIIEVKANDYAIGSICGGGRYDDLAGVFGLKDVSGVGVSFGADRIYDVMLKLDLFPERGGEDVRVLLVNFGGEDELYALDALKLLRENGISSEMYPDPVKMKKQMNYANSRNIPFVLIAGEEERRKGEYTLKDMKTGEQSGLTLDALLEKIQ